MPSLLAPIHGTPYVGGTTPGVLAVGASALQDLRATLDLARGGTAADLSAATLGGIAYKGASAIAIDSAITFPESGKQKIATVFGADTSIPSLRIEDNADAPNYNGNFIEVYSNNPALPRKVFELRRSGGCVLWDYLAVTPNSSPSTWWPANGAMFALYSDLDANGTNVSIINNQYAHDFIQINSYHASGFDSGTRRFTFANSGILAFGAKAATAPALKPSSAILEARLGDDSGYAAFQASTLTAYGASSTIRDAIVMNNTTDDKGNRIQFKQSTTEVGRIACYSNGGDWLMSLGCYGNMTAVWITQQGRVGINVAPERVFHNTVPDAVTNAVSWVNKLTHTSSGTPAAGFGVGIEFELETATNLTNHLAGTLDFCWTTPTAGAEDAYFTLNLAKASIVTEMLRITKDGDLYPGTDDTQYLGRNDDDTPKAWKGLIVKDTTNGKYYRVEVISGVLTATDLTD